MASSSSGTVTSQLQNSGSEGGLVDQRKRKRMQSNRDSARRSRMRKQKHLDDLAAQAAQLRKDNGRIVAAIGVTTGHLVAVEAENQILRAQIGELSQRLRSLDEILSLIGGDTNMFGDFHQTDCLLTGAGVADCFMNPFNLLCLNQPIMASSDMFQY